MVCLPKVVILMPFFPAISTGAREVIDNPGCESISKMKYVLRAPALQTGSRQSAFAEEAAPHGFEP
jgi:hypothetical protein